MMDWDNMIDTQEGLARMVGKTFVQVEGSAGDGEMLFRTADGETFLFGHYQNCCESVRIEDICGDIQDLVGEPILMAEEVSGEAPESDEDHWVRRPGPSTSSLPAVAMWTFAGWVSPTDITQSEWICGTRRVWHKSHTLRG